jgi:hypothetical protein
MRTFKILRNTRSLTDKLVACLAAPSSLALIALGVAGLQAPAYADWRTSDDEDSDVAELKSLVHKADVAEILQLAADFHGALSYNGDPATKSAHLTVMSNLWVEASLLTFSNTVTTATSSFSGKDSVMSFLANGGFFKNNWVSLAPEYKTQVTVHGDTAHISTQCVGIDLTASPMVVKSVIQVEADVVRQGHKWLFVVMHNSSPAPL